MEQNIYICSICNLNNKNLKLFDCSHKVCTKCFYLQGLHNMENILISSDADNEISMDCVHCKTGKLRISQKEILEILSQKPNQNKDLNCATCEQHQEKAEFYCQNCKWLMCNICNDKHNSASIFAHHTVTTSIDEVLSNQKSNAKNVCHKHNKKPFEFHCATCEIPICEACKILSHSDHSLRNIEEYYSESREKLKEMKTYMEEHMEEFEAELEREQEEAIKEIHSGEMEQINYIQGLINKLENLKMFFTNQNSPPTGN